MLIMTNISGCGAAGSAGGLGVMTELSTICRLKPGKLWHTGRNGYFLSAWILCRASARPQLCPQTAKYLATYPQRVIIVKIQYPGVAELVPRQFWELETARSNRVTRTTNKCQYLRFWRLFAFITNFLATIAFQLPLHRMAQYFARGNLYAPLFFVYSGADFD